jgi:peptidoglycan hydrolase CwlO-like protein
MESNLTIHLKMFNDKVKLLNQTQSKQLTLTAQEARNIHADLFDLLNHCFTLSKKVHENRQEVEVVTVGMDGGNF